uniref:Uncharacterized protein n=1 Tax=Rhizophora mucronata TaxID=61149 RepID=A0A2P2K541_RHIMU
MLQHQEKKPGFNSFPNMENPIFTLFKLQKQFIAVSRLYYIICNIQTLELSRQRDHTVAYCFILTNLP